VQNVAVRVLSGTHIWRSIWVKNKAHNATLFLPFPRIIKVVLTSEIYKSKIVVQNIVVRVFVWNAHLFCYAHNSFPTDTCATIVG